MASLDPWRPLSPEDSNTSNPLNLYSFLGQPLKQWWELLYPQKGMGSAGPQVCCAFSDQSGERRMFLKAMWQKRELCSFVLFSSLHSCLDLVDAC